MTDTKLSERMLLDGMYYGIVEEWSEEVAQLEHALIVVRQYLEDRGLRNKGTVGRTQVLPMIDRVLGSETPPPTPKG